MVSITNLNAKLDPIISHSNISSLAVKAPKFNKPSVVDKLWNNNVYSNFEVKNCSWDFLDNEVLKPIWGCEWAWKKVPQAYKLHFAEVLTIGAVEYKRLWIWDRKRNSWNIQVKIARLSHLRNFLCCLQPLVNQDFLSDFFASKFPHENHASAQAFLILESPRIDTKDNHKWL